MSNPYDGDLGSKLTNFVAEEYSGAIVTSMFSIVEFIDPEGEQRLVLASSPGQKVTTSSGILNMAQTIIQLQTELYAEHLLTGDEDDDEGSDE